MKKFIPSRPEEDETLMRLRYLHRAAEVLIQHLQEGSELPSWVQTRITRATLELGTAANFVIHLREKEQ